MGFPEIAGKSWPIGARRSFVIPKEVPAVAMGILDKGLSWEQLFMLPLAA